MVCKLLLAPATLIAQFAQAATESLYTSRVFHSGKLRCQPNSDSILKDANSTFPDRFAATLSLAQPTTFVMASGSFYIEPNVPLEILWAQRVYEQLESYAKQRAKARGLENVDEYDDDNLREARQNMNDTEEAVKLLIKNTKANTGFLPAMGDLLQPAGAGVDTRVVERVLWSNSKAPDTVGIIYYLDTNGFDHLAETDL